MDKGWTDEQLRAMGRLTVVAANLEFQLAVLVWKMIDVDMARGIAITKGRGAQGLLQMAQRLSRWVISPPARRLLPDVLKAVGAAIEGRNRVVHAYWFHSLDTNELQRPSLGQTGMLEFEDFPVTTLEKVVSQLSAAADGVNTVLLELVKFDAAMADARAMALGQSSGDEPQPPPVDDDPPTA